MSEFFPDLLRVDAFSAAVPHAKPHLVRIVHVPTGHVVEQDAGVPMTKAQMIERLRILVESAA